MNKISIIIPILNEAEYITKLLQHLLNNSSTHNIKNIIIVDGGSSDDSQKNIETFVTLKKTENIYSITSGKGRAKQMNYGAKHAQAEILYFIHADSYPPKDFDLLILNEIKKGNKAGCFIMKFNSSHLWLKLAGWLTQLPYKSCRGGDQSLFITNNLFEQLKGYNENFIVYEDNELIYRLFDLKQFVVIRKWLTTSARRYNKNGIFKLQWHFFIIHLKKFFGASAHELYGYYKRHIK